MSKALVQTEEEIKPLSSRERMLLEELERRIVSEFSAFHRVGMALAEINERQLYRETHRTFESYCKNLWDMALQHGNIMVEPWRSVPQDGFPDGRGLGLGSGFHGLGQYGIDRCNWVNRAHYGRCWHGAGLPRWSSGYRVYHGRAEHRQPGTHHGRGRAGRGWA